MENLQLAARALAASKRAVTLTGAGISRESGIPTFRGAGGLWRRHRPERLASREGFLADPGLVWSWYMERLRTARRCRPNAGHLALARLEKLLPRLTLITQNVDNLHGRAGSREIVELHGNIERFHCLDRSHPVAFDPGWNDTPPRCACGSLVRPAVVWFGEELPRAALESAWAAASGCDVMLVVGTSGLVHPAAALPALAAQSGAVVIELNVDDTPLTPLAGIVLRGTAEILLPQLAALTEDRLARPG